MMLMNWKISFKLQHLRYAERSEVTKGVRENLKKLGFNVKIQMDSSEDESTGFLQHISV